MYLARCYEGHKNLDMIFPLKDLKVDLNLNNYDIRAKIMCFVKAMLKIV